MDILILHQDNQLSVAYFHDFSYNLIYFQEKEGSWGVMTDRITFADFNFVVSYHHLRMKKKTAKNNKQTEGGEFPLLLNMSTSYFLVQQLLICMERV